MNRCRWWWSKATWTSSPASAPASPRSRPWAPRLAKTRWSILYKATTIPSRHSASMATGPGQAGRVPDRLLDRALPLLKPGKSFRFAIVEGGKDPDDVLREQGAAALKSQLAQFDALRRGPVRLRERGRRAAGHPGAQDRAEDPAAQARRHHRRRRPVAGLQGGSAEPLRAALADAGAGLHRLGRRGPRRCSRGPLGQVPRRNANGISDGPGNRPGEGRQPAPAGVAAPACRRPGAMPPSRTPASSTTRSKLVGARGFGDEKLDALAQTSWCPFCATRPRAWSSTPRSARTGLGARLRPGHAGGAGAGRAPRRGLPRPSWQQGHRRAGPRPVVCARRSTC